MVGQNLTKHEKGYIQNNQLLPESPTEFTIKSITLINFKLHDVKLYRLSSLSKGGGVGPRLPY